ncbi:YkgJ family cysteine cluster protein [Oleiphilus sp. HI0125]|uniref:YkgJ family cysteine cluster protein n=1 Tax=Oleiphilus sp. HI0125 TaxID=1822266 RepID=UPI0009EE0899|nr:YkgJ family cysteine cluster protein [Oleiphilus sp. HI0125]
MKCHDPCGACCIAPEITSALPNMPDGKPAGIRCVNLDSENRCMEYEKRPKVCREFNPTEYTCGDSFEDALRLISELEAATKS